MGADPTTAATAGTFDLIDSAINANAQNHAIKDQYKYNRKLQNHDQKFQKMMRDTQYQATVNDMQQAGINPAVALSSGAGLSQAQGGSSSSVSAPQYGGTDIASAFLNAIGTQNQTALTQSQVDNIDADTDLKNEQAGLTNEQKKTEKYKREFDRKTEQIRIALMTGELTKQQYDMMVNQATTDLLQEQVGIARAERKTAENNRRWHEIRDSIVAFIPYVTGMTKKSGGITINNN